MLHLSDFSCPAIHRVPQRHLHYRSHNLEGKGFVIFQLRCTLWLRIHPPADYCPRLPGLNLHCELVMSCAATPSFFTGGKNMGREYNYYRQKRLCRATERRRGLSATRIHSTVGQQALLVNVPQTFQTCACIVIETTEFFPILEVSSSSGWFDFSSLHQSCFNYCTSCVFHATVNTIALISSNTLFFGLISIFYPLIYLSCLELQV